jgi:putative membrane-bound dehydrogenase-like protein
MRIKPCLLVAAFGIGSIGLAAAASADSNGGKPAFASPVVTMRTPGYAVDVDADITGAKQLYLVVTDADDGIAADWSDWAEPRLIGASGEKKLTELRWKSATSGWGQPQVNHNCSGKQLIIHGEPIPYGIGTHSNSLIVYDLPPGYTRFKAKAGIDKGGTDQGNPSSSSVRFMVYTSAPPRALVAQTSGASQGGGGNVDHDPAKAVSYLDVADGLEMTLFCSEPRMTNPTNIDIDPQGRVWVCDVQNYRGHNGLRPAGDRILVMQDTTGSGTADKVTTFYQGRDIDSALGICVLGDRVVVACSPNVWVFTDDGNLKPANKEALFTKTGNPQHDHDAHASVFGPDGKLYWNCGNATRSVHDKDGKPIVDLEGNEVNDSGHPYRNGMVFRCNLDGSQFETLAWNFRNNYEVCVDSFGTMWQSDNDDDGNRGVRINYVMQHGNYGYTDEFTGAGWNSPYLGQPADTPSRHWHQSDPGVVPNLLQTGAGAPCGITVNEGDLLPKVFHDQMIHADAGPSIVRAYPVEKDGAGYKAEIVDIVSGARNRWFRPDDVCIAPDGSLFISDWYDPGVGGHAQADTERGRIFRIAPKGSKYVVPKFDFTTIDGAIEALKNPCLSVRYEAWTHLHAFGAQAEPALLKLYGSENPRFRARALWLLSKIEGQGNKHIDMVLKDPDSDLRITALRAAVELGGDLLPVVAQVVHDPSPQVRREAALTLRHVPGAKAAELWTELALQNTGNDRWYTEALGLGADKQWDSFFAAWQAKVGPDWNGPGGREIVWRSRAKAALPLLAKLISDPATTKTDRIRYFRAFDFHTDPSKQAVLLGLLSGHGPLQAEIAPLALKQLHGADANSPQLKAALDSVLDSARGTDQFVDLVIAFHRTDRADELLNVALSKSDTTLGVKAAQQLFNFGAANEFKKPLAGDDATAEKALTVLGLTQDRSAVALLLPVALDAKRALPVRIAAVEALAHSRNGELTLLDLARRNKVPGELQFAIAKALGASTDSRIVAEAGRYFKMPESAGGAKLPPLAELVRRRGNVEHGKLVFNTTGTCVKCHTINGVGKDVGPNLSEIGNKATRDFLYESILLPSAAIAHNFESHRLDLDNGTSVVGIVTSDTKESISIKTADAILHTYKKSEVERNTELKVSIMPADLQKLMSVNDLVDVVEYLTTVKTASRH